MRRENSSARRFAPALESLGDRVVPSCTWVEENGTLTITGDAGDNVVEIADDGTVLTITCDGEAVDLSAAVTEVVVNLGSGADSVTYTLTGDLTAEAARSFDVNLGSGADTFTGTLEAGLLDGAALDLVVRGSNGGDNLGFAAASDVGADASLSVDLGGGNGKDTVDLVFGGVLLGDAVLSASGGNGKDLVSAEVAVAAGSTGTVDAGVLGGNGKDELVFLATDESGDDGDPLTDDSGTLAAWSAVADGGNGPDTAEVSDLVDTVSARTV